MYNSSKKLVRKKLNLISLFWGEKQWSGAGKEAQNRMQFKEKVKRMSSEE